MLMFGLAFYNIELFQFSGYKRFYFGNFNFDRIRNNKMGLSILHLKLIVHVKPEKEKSWIHSVFLGDIKAKDLVKVPISMDFFAWLQRHNVFFRFWDSTLWGMNSQVLIIEREYVEVHVGYNPRSTV